MMPQILSIPLEPHFGPGPAATAVAVVSLTGAPGGGAGGKDAPSAAASTAPTSTAITTSGDAAAGAKKANKTKPQSFSALDGLVQILSQAEALSKEEPQVSVEGGCEKC